MSFNNNNNNNILSNDIATKILKAIEKLQADVDEIKAGLHSLQAQFDQQFAPVLTEEQTTSIEAVERPTGKIR